MDKDVVHIHNGILFSHEKKTNPTICNNMDGARGYYAQRNKQVEKDKNQRFHSYVQYKNKEKMKEQNSIRLKDTEKWLVVTKGGGCWTTVMYTW